MITYVKDIFTDIFYCKAWGDIESCSGPGSSVAEASTIAKEIPKLVKLYNIRTFLDLPCGDFNWMQHVDLGVDKYIGADIVQEIVQSNVEKYSSPTREFKHLDLLSDNLPSADLVLCRDCLVHLAFPDIAKALTNLHNSGIHYLLTTTFPKWTANGKIETGGWTPRNLALAPFNFPEPIELINENCPAFGFSDKSLGLWRINSLPKQLTSYT